MKVLALVAGLLLLAGCSAAPAAPTTAPIHVPPNAEFNEADVMFLQMMVPQLEEGLNIVRLAKDRASRHEVVTLAAAIETTASSEAWTMTERLRDWRQPQNAPPNSHSEHGGQPGIAAQEFAALRGLSGPDFEHRFLNALIALQDDAIQLAKLEAATGSNPATKALAEQVDRSRSAQIAQMKGLLGE